MVERILMAVSQMSIVGLANNPWKITDEKDEFSFPRLIVVYSFLAKVKEIMLLASWSLGR